MNLYEYWTRALAGEKPKPFVDDPQAGFYRKGVYDRTDKGWKHRIGWEPVAIFPNGDGTLVGLVGDREVNSDALNDLWSYVCANPISEEVYRAVAEEGKPWPEEHDPSKSEIVAPTESTSAAALPPEEMLSGKIAILRNGVSQYTKIESDEMAARAASLKNELTTLIGKYDKIREGLVRPHLDAQDSINKRFRPTIKAAQDECKLLLRNIGAWEDFKREQAKKTETNAPPPTTQITPAVGRKLKPTVKKFVVQIDLDKAFAQFRDNTALQNCLFALAQSAIDAGLDVPGAVIEERTVV